MSRTIATARITARTNETMTFALDLSAHAALLPLHDATFELHAVPTNGGGGPALHWPSADHVLFYSPETFFLTLSAPESAVRRITSPTYEYDLRAIFPSGLIKVLVGGPIEFERGIS